MTETVRVSKRVADKIIKEQQDEEVRLKRNTDAHLATINQFFDSAMSSPSVDAVFETDDFDLPAEWKKPDAISRANNNNNIPRFRKLKQNLYRPPLQRPSYNEDEDAPICGCDISGCGENCHNRTVFMECAPGICPSLPGLSKECGECNQGSDNESNASSQRGFPRSSATDDISQTNSAGGDLSDNDSEDEEEEDEDAPNDEDQRYCLNTVIQTKRYPLTEVFLSPMCGHALRVLEAVPAHAILIEYLGEVITAKECTARMSAYEDGDDFYFAALGGGLMLDAKHMGSIARFANHSCDPNSCLQKWTVAGEIRIVLATTRALPEGSEITYNYQYFDDGMDGLLGMKRQVCKCGAKQCCGTIGGRVAVSVEDSIVTKTAAMLASGRKYSRDALCTQLDLLRDGKVACTPQVEHLIVDLEAILAQGDQWVQRYFQLMAQAGRSSPKSSVERLADLSAAQSLLQSCPSVVRVEQFALLEGAVKRALRAEKAVGQLRAIVEGGGGGPVVKSEGNVKFESGTVIVSVVDKLRVVWEDVVSALRLVHSALPLHCPSTHLLVQWMNQYNDWCRRHICAVVPSVPATGKNAVVQTATSTRGLMHHIAQVYSHHAVNSSDSEAVDVFSQFLSTQSDSSHAEDFLETRLNTYIEKNNTVSKMQRRAMEGSADSGGDSLAAEVGDSSVANDNATLNKYRQLLHSELQSRLQSVCEGEDSTDPVLRSVRSYLDQHSSNTATIDGNSTSNSSMNIVSLDSTATSSSSASPDTDAPLFCLCRLPETQGESSVMSQCDMCDDWFHPQCINAPLVSATAMRRSDASFVCPVCLHMTCKVSGFSLPPVTEWRRIQANQQVQEEKGRAHSNKTHKKSTNSSRSSISGAKKRPRSEVVEEDDEDSSPVRSVNRRLSAIEKREIIVVPAGSPDATRDVSSDDQLVSNAQIKSEPLEDFPVSAPHFTTQLVSSAKKAPPKKPTSVPALRPRDFLSLQDVQNGMDAEQRISISGTPVSLLLNLCAKYATDWQQRVQQHFSSEAVLSVIQRLAASPAVISVEQLLQETAVLRDSLTLYFELRLLRVCPTAEVNRLRALVWSISTASLNRSVAADSDGMSASVVMQADRCSLHQLSDLIAGGKAVIAAVTVGGGKINNDVDTLQSARVVLNRLIARHQNAVSVLAEASRCASVDVARALLVRLQAVQSSLDLGSDFNIARVMCLSRPATRRAASGHCAGSAQGGVNVAVASHSDNVATSSVIATDNDDESNMTVDVITVSSTPEQDMDLTYPEEEFAPLVAPPILTVPTCTAQEEEVAPIACSVVEKEEEEREDEDDRTEYCWCRGEDDGSPMIGCDTCEDWFHAQCVNVRERESSKKKKKGRKGKAVSVDSLASFECISCCVLGGRPYPHKW